MLKALVTVFVWIPLSFILAGAITAGICSNPYLGFAIMAAIYLVAIICIVVGEGRQMKQSRLQYTAPTVEGLQELREHRIRQEAVAEYKSRLEAEAFARREQEQAVDLDD